MNGSSLSGPVAYGWRLKDRRTTTLLKPIAFDEYTKRLEAFVKSHTEDLRPRDITKELEEFVGPPRPQK